VTHKDLLKLLNDNDVEFVVVGGTALRIYNSPRVTHDIDLSIRIMDVDTVVRLMYANSYYLVQSLKPAHCILALTAEKAVAWIDREKVGSTAFIQTRSVPQKTEIANSEVNIASQIDFLFELAIPFPRLRQRARIVELEDVSFPVASPEDLLFLKKKRTDKDAADLEDIRFLQELLKKGLKS